MLRLLHGACRRPHLLPSPSQDSLQQRVCVELMKQSSTLSHHFESFLCLRRSHKLHCFQQSMSTLPCHAILCCMSLLEWYTKLLWCSGFLSLSLVNYSKCTRCWTLFFSIFSGALQGLCPVSGWQKWQPWCEVWPSTYLLSLVSELREDVKRLRTIRESETETGKATRKKLQDQGDPVSSHYQTEGSNLKSVNGRKRMVGVAGKPPSCPLCLFRGHSPWVWVSGCGNSVDEVNDGPFIPVVFPRSERPTSHQDHLHEEEKTGYGCRWLSSGGNRKSPVLD